MNMVAAIKAAYEPSPFERKWRRMTRTEKRALLCGNHGHGWFAQTDPMIDYLIDYENAATVEMVLKSRGASADYLAGDYEMIGSKRATDWGE